LDTGFNNRLRRVTLPPRERHFPATIGVAYLQSRKHCARFSVAERFEVEQDGIQKGAVRINY
jgi:hypothetical protein